MAIKYLRNAKARKAAARISRGKEIAGDRERIFRLVTAFEARPQPKLLAQRVHKQHKHPLRDEHGAYSLVGATYEMQAAEGQTITPSSREHVFGGSFGNGGHTDYTARRKWLAGVSERRGY